MIKEIASPYLDEQCFYCGQKNSEGFRLKFFLDEQTGVVFTEFLPTFPYVGQGNIVHCGIVTGLLDEVMGWTSYVSTGEMAVTSDLQVKFLKPYIWEKR